MNTTTIDLAPLFNLVVWPSLSIVALALATFIAAKISAWTGSQNQERMRVLVNGILQSGLQAAQAKVATSNIELIEVQSGIVADALGYAVANGPSALKALGVDVETQAGREEVRQKIEAMLAPAVMVAASSPSQVSVATAATIVNPTIPTSPATLGERDPSAPGYLPGAGTGSGSVAQVTADAKPPTEPT